MVKWVRLAFIKMEKLFGCCPSTRKNAALVRALDYLLQIDRHLRSSLELYRCSPSEILFLSWPVNLRTHIRCLGCFIYKVEAGLYGALPNGIIYSYRSMTYEKRMRLMEVPLTYCFSSHTGWGQRSPYLVLLWLGLIIKMSPKMRKMTLADACISHNKLIMESL